MTTHMVSASELGMRAYYAAHARIGDSTAACLNEATARASCPEGVDVEGWLIGWTGARERDLWDRIRYAGHAWVPLPGLGL